MGRAYSVEIRNFLLVAGGTLLVVYAVQLATFAIFGKAAHDAVFMLEREHWYRMWTPFTSAVAHGPPTHLPSTLLALVVMAPPLVALYGARRTLGGIYLAAVLGQFVGVVSGRGDILGISAGVMAAGAATAILAPFWMPRLLAWGLAPVRQAIGSSASTGQMLTGSTQFAIAALVPIAIGWLLGAQLASDVAGMQQYLTYPWGEAPSGAVYSAHIFGFALGAGAGLVLAVHRIFRPAPTAPPGTVAV